MFEDQNGASNMVSVMLNGPLTVKMWCESTGKRIKSKLSAISLTSLLIL